MTEGERIVRHWWPKYKAGQWQACLAEQIDEAIKKEGDNAAFQSAIEESTATYD